MTMQEHFDQEVAWQKEWTEIRDRIAVDCRLVTRHDVERIFAFMEGLFQQRQKMAELAVYATIGEDTINLRNAILRAAREGR